MFTDSDLLNLNEHEKIVREVRKLVEEHMGLSKAVDFDRFLTKYVDRR